MKQFYNRQRDLSRGELWKTQGEGLDKDNKIKRENRAESISFLFKIRNLEKIYKKTIQENLKDIKAILRDIDIDEPSISSYDKIFSSSCSNLSKKWSSKRKYIRTLFVKEAFSNFYPEKYLKLSLYVDSIVNILDDLLDEKMDKKEEVLYIIEFLRVFSLYNQGQPSKDIQAVISHYFNKLITLAIAEKHYRNLIKKEIKIERIIKYSIRSFNVRSLDIDVFNEIALMQYGLPNRRNETIKKMSRLFRAVNLIKKDIEDIEYDTRHNLETIITIMIRKRECDFSKYILDLLDYYLTEAKKIKLVKFLEEKDRAPINNFYRMIERDKREILNLVNLYKS